MTIKYRALLTNQGKALLAEAAANGQKLTITQMAVGDGDGNPSIPDEQQTQLVHEIRRAPLNSLQVDTNNNQQIIAEQIIPESEGGWWIRELGLYDSNGILVAVANTPDTYKPLLTEGAGRTQVVRMVLVIKGDANAVIVADKTSVLVSRDTLNIAIEEHARSRNHPDATLQAKGFTQLSNAIDSDSEIHAVTPKALKTINDEVKKRLPLNGGILSGRLLMNYQVGVWGQDTKGTQHNLAMIGNGTFPDTTLFGGSNLPMVLLSQDNPRTSVSGKIYTLYHTGNKPSAGDVGTYSKDEANGMFVQKSGDTISGGLTVNGAIETKSGLTTTYLTAKSDVTVNGNISIDKDATIKNSLNVNGSGFIYKTGVYTEESGKRNTQGLRIQGEGNQFVDYYFYEETGERAFGGIRVASGGIDAWYQLGNAGDLRCFGTWPRLMLGDSTYFNDGNINGSIWGGYLSNYLMQNFVQDIRLGNVESVMSWKGPGYPDASGYVLTGALNGNKDEFIDSIFRRPLQKKINNQWITVWSV